MKPGSDGRQEGRMNEHRDVTSFLVSRFNQPSRNLLLLANYRSADEKRFVFFLFLSQNALVQFNFLSLIFRSSSSSTSTQVSTCCSCLSHLSHMFAWYAPTTTVKGKQPGNQRPNEVRPCAVRNADWKCWSSANNTWLQCVWLSYSFSSFFFLISSSSPSHFPTVTSSQRQHPHSATCAVWRTALRTWRASWRIFGYLTTCGSGFSCGLISQSWAKSSNIVPLSA